MRKLESFIMNYACAVISAHVCGDIRGVEEIDWIARRHNLANFLTHGVEISRANRI